MKINFTKYLTKKDVITFLDNAGYKLCDNLITKNGEVRKSYNKNKDKETGTYSIFLICDKKEAESLKSNITLSKALFKAMMPLNLFSFDSLYDNFGHTLILVDDYLVSTLGNCEHFIESSDVKDSGKLQDKYANYMIEKFGEFYREKYNQFVKMYNAKIEKNKENENIQAE
jgi:hypothetical protein